MAAALASEELTLVPVDERQNQGFCGSPTKCPRTQNQSTGGKRWSRRQGPYDELENMKYQEDEMAEPVLPPKYDLNEYGQGIWEFDPDRDLKLSPTWLIDFVHFYPPMCPYSLHLSCQGTQLGWSHAADYISEPYTRAIAWRPVRGLGALTAIPVEDEQDIRQREAKYRERMRPYFEDFNKQYSATKAALDRIYTPLKQVDFDKEDDFKLWERFEESLDVWYQHRRAKFSTIIPAADIWTLFINTCSELLGIDDTSPLFLRLFQGMDNAMLDGDAEQMRLANRAAELGLTDIFASTSVTASEAIPRLETSENGRKWLKEFKEFLSSYGWRLARFNVPETPSWIEDPSPALSGIANYLASGAVGVREQRKKEAVEDRKRAEDEILQMVPQPRREEFNVLLKSAQTSHVCCDEHDFFIDFPSWTLTRHITIAIGRRMVNQGIIDQPDDIFYFIPEEIRQAFFARPNLREVVNKRRAVHRQYLSEPQPPPIYGSLSLEETFGYIAKARESVIQMFIFGRPPKVKPELKADLYGVGVSGGVVEGLARLVMNEMELRQIRKGEILVAPNTSASWTWAFAVIGGVVVDHGGIGSHTSVVSREYRIPGVVNTMAGTAKIKTGQRIRVDGNEGTVHILE